MELDGICGVEILKCRQYKRCTLLVSVVWWWCSVVRWWDSHAHEIILPYQSKRLWFASAYHATTLTSLRCKRMTFRTAHSAASINQLSKACMVHDNVHPSLTRALIIFPRSLSGVGSYLSWLCIQPQPKSIAWKKLEVICYTRKKALHDLLILLSL